MRGTKNTMATISSKNKTNIAFTPIYYSMFPLPIDVFFLQDALYDEDPLRLTAVKEETITVAEFTRDLIKKSKFFDVMLPRIPVPIQKVAVAVAPCVADCVVPEMV